MEAVIVFVPVFVAIPQSMLTYPFFVFAVVGFSVPVPADVSLKLNVNVVPSPTGLPSASVTYRLISVPLEPSAWMVSFPLQVIFVGLVNMTTEVMTVLSAITEKEWERPSPYGSFFAYRLYDHCPFVAGIPVNW